MVKSTSAGRRQPTHSLSPTAACNPTSGIIYIYCSCMFYLNIWQWWSSPRWGGNCFVNHICSQLFAWVCPKGGKVSLRNRGEKSVIYNKREKDVQKASQNAAGELWLPARGNFLALCGCEAVMHQWPSRPPQPLTKYSWRTTRHATMRRRQTAHNETSTRRKTALNDKLRRKDVNSQSEMGKNKNRRQKREKKTNRRKTQRAKADLLDQWQSMTNHQHTTRILHTAPDSGKDSKGSMQTYRTTIYGKHHIKA